MDKTSNKFKFLMHLFRAGAIVSRKLSGQGLGFGDLAVLYAIGQTAEGKIDIEDLGKKLGLTVSESNRILLSTEKLGAVKKETQGRKNFVLMTEKGRNMFGDAVKFTELRIEGLVPKEEEKNIETVNQFLSSLL